MATNSDGPVDRMSRPAGRPAGGAAPTLVLFDIDGTLVSTGGAGVRGMNAAFEALYGRGRALDGVPIAGRTDRAITSDAMRGLEVEPTDEAIIRLREAYLPHLRFELERPDDTSSRILPGVNALLDALEGEGAMVTALLTGNFEGGAAIKLGHFDLWGRFQFGAFGDRHTNRRDLLPIALRVAEEAGCGRVAAERVVIVGDTPHDVDCAKAHGARAIAVATGLSDCQALRDAGADFVVETLEDVDAVLAELRRSS